MFRTKKMSTKSPKRYHRNVDERRRRTLRPFGSLMSTDSPFGTFSSRPGRMWRSTRDSFRTISRRISPDKIPLPFRRRRRKTWALLRIAHTTVRFSLPLFHESRKTTPTCLPPSRIIGQTSANCSRLRATATRG